MCMKKITLLGSHSLFAFFCIHLGKLIFNILENLYKRMRYELLFLNSMDFSTLIIGLIVPVTISLPLCGLEMKDGVRRNTAQKWLISMFDAFTK